MDVNRRNLMKGVLTGGTLLALGVPPGAFASAPAEEPKDLDCYWEIRA